MRLDRRTFLRLVVGSRDAPTLVVVFLRGGADGLNMVVPHAEREYFDRRPTISISDVVNLDGAFGLHPGLRPLERLFHNRRLAVVHAVGSDDETRSHFEAQDLMERGGSRTGGVTGGWIARHLRARPGPVPTALSAVAVGRSIPEAFRGAPGATAFTSLDDVRIPGGARMVSALSRLYAGEDPLLKAGAETIETLRTLQRITAEPLPTASAYPEGEFGRALREVARLIRAGVGLEVAHVDFGGWDTHVVQGAGIGQQASLLEQLGRGLAAFYDELGDARMKNVCIVTMSEFGRRTSENAGFGTDHGRAGVMLLIGGAIAGGRVVADWPGLAEDQLEGPGDLRVTIDYRDILAEILTRVLGNPNVDRVFPGMVLKPRGVTVAPK